MKILHMTMDRDDPITNALVKSSNKSNLLIMTIEDFINEVTVFDRSNMNGSRLSWEYRGQVITNSKDTILLSRICHLPNKISQQFNKVDQEYAVAELEAYFGFAFNAFNSLNLDIDERGCISRYSLPMQWKKVQSQKKSILTPEYYLGDNRFNHLSKENLVYSNIYQYNLWSQQPSEKIESESIFCFKKPSGIPVVFLNVNSQLLVTEIPGNKKLSAPEISELTAVAENIAKMFQYFVSELLLFYHKGDITFGCICPYIIQSNLNNQFNSMVANTIEEAVNSYEKYIYA